MVARKTLREGFTLVELMIVVAIVGVLAVLAVYGISKYIAIAKTAEARNSLGQIGQDAVTAFESERTNSAGTAGDSAITIVRQLCQTGATVSVPTTASSIDGKKYQSAKADWSNPADVSTNVGWPCLKFEMTAPQYYQYSYMAEGTTAGSFTATAVGNLNGDTAYSTFTLLGAVENGRLKLAPTIGETSPEE